MAYAASGFSTSTNHAAMAKERTRTKPSYARFITTHGVPHEPIGPYQTDNHYARLTSYHVEVLPLVLIAQGQLVESNRRTRFCHGQATCLATSQFIRFPHLTSSSVNSP